MPRSLVQHTFRDGLETAIAKRGAVLGPTAIKRHVRNRVRFHTPAAGERRTRRIRRLITATVSAAILSGSVLIAAAPSAEALPRCTDLYAYAMSAQWAWSTDIGDGNYEAAATQAEVLDGYLRLIRDYC